MTDSETYSPEFCLALLYEFLTRVRVGVGDSESNSAIAYALHNLPSILLVPEWNDEIGDQAYREVIGKARLSGATDWIATKTSELESQVENGHEVLSAWKY